MLFLFCAVSGCVSSIVGPISYAWSLWKCSACSGMSYAVETVIRVQRAASPPECKIYMNSWTLNNNTRIHTQLDGNDADFPASAAVCMPFKLLEVGKNVTHAHGMNQTERRLGNMKWCVPLLLSSLSLSSSSIHSISHRARGWNTRKRGAAIR